MKKQPKVLVLSRDSWNTTNNSGNTLSNLFQNWESKNIANIYCRDEIPNNSICTHYFKISESILVKKILGKVKVAGEKHGQLVSMTKEISEEQIKLQNSEKKLYDFFRNNRWHIFLWGRELLWKIVKWKTRELRQFVLDFNPDIIYSPSYDSFYMHDILKYVKENTKAKVIYFHCDDLVTYRQYSVSPFYWINRYFLRKKMDKSIITADKNYCIIDEQAKVYRAIYNIEFNLLYKTGEFISIPETKTVNTPLKMVYTGNIIYGRINSIMAVAKALKEVNKDSMKIQLFLYTANPISEAIRIQLLETRSVVIMDKVSYEKIPTILANSDVLLHVESFEKQQMLATSLSFSTKLVDYFQAAKPILALGWEKAASIKYLKDNAIGLTVNDVENLFAVLSDLSRNKDMLNSLGSSIWEFGQSHHNHNFVLRNFENDLMSISELGKV